MGAAYLKAPTVPPVYVIGCTGKLRHGSKAQAVAFDKRSRGRTGQTKVLHPYRCDFCLAWHLTSEGITKRTLETIKQIAPTFPKQRHQREKYMQKIKKRRLASTAKP